MRSLHTQIREAALLAGIDRAEADWAASFFQIDHSVIYQCIQQDYQGPLELMTTQEALQRSGVSRELSERPVQAHRYDNLTRQQGGTRCEPHHDRRAGHTPPVPESPWMSRAYSIGNAPHEGGAVELQLRRVEGGRFSSWAFEKMKVGDVVTARGPLGTFRIRSPLSTPLLFVARGTGFAPIKAMIEQQLTLAPDREMILYWGVTDTGDFYDLEELTAWAASDPHFRATLTARHDSLGFRAPVGVKFHTGTVYQALTESELELRSRDAYVAGPPKTVAAVVEALLKKGVSHERILVDSYGL